MNKEQIIEAMAKALYANDDKYGKYPWGIATDRIKEMFRSDARAAYAVCEKHYKAEAERLRGVLREIAGYADYPESSSAGYLARRAEQALEQLEDGSE